MAIAQRMRQPGPPPILVVIGVVALVLGVAALTFNWINSSSTPVTAPYSQFLGDVMAGQVTQVVQTGTTLEVSGPHGTYVVTVPTILTDVYGDMERAAAGSAAVPSFTAHPEPDTSWIGLVVIGVLPLALLLVVLVVVLRFMSGSARLASARTLTGRLRELDEAHRAGLISDEERVRQRARILDDT